MIEGQPSYLALGAEDVKVATHPYTINVSPNTFAAHHRACVDNVFACSENGTFVFLSPIRDRHTSHTLATRGLRRRSPIDLESPRYFRPDVATV